MSSAIKVVALGGGHGLAATLTALRKITTDITAIVTVADDGGSSGRLRQEFGIIPPGDLRMALAALCGAESAGWAEVVQHRFAGDGPLAGHAVGNLLLAALWELHGDSVAGLDAVASLLQVQGRVLPMAAVPLEITAQVRTGDVDQSVTTVRGQVAVASARGEVLSISLEPADPPARPEALAAIAAAEWITVGPGSWYSSVLTHLLVPEQRRALRDSAAKKILILNVVSDDHDADEMRKQPADVLLHVLTEHAPDLHFDFVLADRTAIGDEQVLAAAAEKLGAALVLGDMSTSDGGSRHQPELLAGALEAIIIGSDRAEGAKTLPRLTR
jgi:uncharacterized cofD-like protein